MASNTSLEALLRTLVNAPEPEKTSVLQAILKALREACGLFSQSGFSEYQESAQKVQDILDSLATAPVPDEEWEEDDEFVESGTFGDSKFQQQEDEDRPQTIVSTDTKSAAEVNTPQMRLNRLIAKWNDGCVSWLKLPAIALNDRNSVATYVTSRAAMRSNLLSNTFDSQTEILQKFDDNWQQIITVLKEANYRLDPDNWNEKAAQPKGRIVYTCRSRSTESEKELLRPGLFWKDEIIHDPAWVISLPLDGTFPQEHPYAALASHWRGILGETEALLEVIAIQPKVFAAVEGINKNRIESLDDCRESIITELKRREEVLYGTILKGDEESSYRLATDYWRVEECFWSLYHDDDRPVGCSYFDRMRNRMQAWRTTLRRVVKFHIRDFACGNDSLASVNQYIGNIILQPQKNVPAGTVLRELRPAIVIKDQATSRLLKGRVIAT